MGYDLRQIINQEKGNIASLEEIDDLDAASRILTTLVERPDIRSLMDIVLSLDEAELKLFLNIAENYMKRD